MTRETITTIQKATMIHEEGRTARPPGVLTDADDRLPRAPLGRVEGGDSFVEGRDGADVRPQSSVTRPPDNLTQLGAIGYDDEVNRPAVSGSCLGRAGDGHQRSSGSNHARGPLRDVAAEDIEHQIDSADIFQSVVFEVRKLLRAEVERRLAAGSAPGTDDVRPGLTCELGCHRTDYAGRTVYKDTLPRLKAAVLEQPPPRGPASRGPRPPCGQRRPAAARGCVPRRLHTPPASRRESSP